MSANHSKHAPESGKVLYELQERCKWSTGTTFPHRYVRVVHSYFDEDGNSRELETILQLPDDEAKRLDETMKLPEADRRASGKVVMLHNPANSCVGKGFKDNETILTEAGWEIECQSPLEIRHPDGSFATGGAALSVVACLREELDDA